VKYSRHATTSANKVHCISPLYIYTYTTQLLRGPAGEKYLRLLSHVELPGPEALLVKFCHLQCLEALSLEVADMPRLFISNMDRRSLSG
jgi:hypothetical protein